MLRLGNGGVSRLANPPLLRALRFLDQGTQVIADVDSAFPLHDQRLPEKRVYDLLHLFARDRS